MTKENPFSYAETESRRESWEKPVAVTSALEYLGLPSQQHLESAELSPNEAVDIDNRALQYPDCPSVCYGRPHAGEFIPTELWERTTEVGRRNLAVIDRGTDFIFRSSRIPSVGTKINRFIIDPNRPIRESEKTNVPGRLLWQTGINDTPIYREGLAPSDKEVTEWTEKFYLPYYNGMMAVIGSLTDRRKNKAGRILVVDGHSFPTSEMTRESFRKFYNINEPTELPMFILGDREGESCDSDIRDAFIAALKRNFESLDPKTQGKISVSIRGGLVGINHPFKGVHNVKFYGSRNEGVNALQLECNENMYVDETGGDYWSGQYNQEKLRIVQSLIETTCGDIDSILKSKK